MKKKRILLAVLALICTLFTVLPVSASGIAVTTEDFVAPLEYETGEDTSENTIYPTDIRYESAGSKRYIYKTYRLSEDFPLESLIASPYEEDGYYWKNNEVLHRETISNTQTKEATETVNLTTVSQDPQEIVKEFPLTISYQEAGYEGTLLLDSSSLQITPGKQESYHSSYTVSASREYPNLPSNDMAQIPKSITQNSIAYTLATVDWCPTAREGSSGYSDYITQYTATAHYTGTAVTSGVTTEDYHATADYTGEVIKSAPNTLIYTIVYKGSIIPPIPVPSPPYLLIALATLLLILLALWLFLKLKGNTKLYIIEHGVPKLYRRTRISADNPIINIEGLEECRLQIVLTKRLVDRLPQRKVYLESDRNNYAVTLGNQLVIQYPPVTKPTLEVSAATSYPAEESTSNPPTPHSPKPSDESISWHTDFGERAEKPPEEPPLLDLKAMEEEEQVFHVFWKGESDENKE